MLFYIVRIFFNVSIILFGLKGNSNEKLVLIGGGYGNMRVLHRLLPNQLPDDVSITLIDRNPYHCLKTEYYALAAGTISDHHIRVSFPEHPRTDVQYGDISSIDIAQNKCCSKIVNRFLTMTL